MDPDDFLKNYYLKTELKAICKKFGLPVSGSKSELTERIETYLRTGNKKPSIRRKTRPFVEDPNVLTSESIIPENFHANQKYRKYFESNLGKTFRFHTRFLSFLKSHPGITLKQAGDVYHLLLEEKKASPKRIEAQFKYNQYIRDFFKHNPKRSLQEAICCWHYRKKQPGDHKYYPEDLSVLNNT